MVSVALTITAKWSSLTELTQLGRMLEGKHKSLREVDMG